MKTGAFIIWGFLMLFLFAVSPTHSGEPINKHLVDKAPKEERAPMPHLDPDNTEKKWFSSACRRRFSGSRTWNR